jgi:hypothetical protein
MPIDTILRRLYTLAVVTGWIFLAVILFYLARPRADWETITHEQYGFSFEYPTEWRVSKYGEDISYHGDEELKVLLSLPWNDYASIEIRVVPMNSPTLDKAVRWGEQRIARINRLLVSRGDEPITELYWRKEVLNGQTIARRRYQGYNVRTGEVYLAEDVYLVRAGDIIVFMLRSRESSFEYFTDEFERIISSFSTVE